MAVLRARVPTDPRVRVGLISFLSLAIVEVVFYPDLVVFWGGVPHSELDLFRYFYVLPAVAACVVTGSWWTLVVQKRRPVRAIGVLLLVVLANLILFAGLIFWSIPSFHLLPAFGARV